MRDATYVVFSSDNGPQDEHWTNNNKGAFSNAVGRPGPFRGCKGSLYDGGHRVPFIVTGPSVPAGRVDHSLLSAVDWLPTIAALAGAPVPAGTLLRGVDVSHIWSGKAHHATTRAAPLIWRGGGGPAPCWNRSPGLAARNGDWKLLLNEDGTRVELYNVSVGQLGRSGDRFEAHNEADAQPAAVALLRQAAEAWSATTPCPYGAKPGGCHKFVADGCEAYPFPGVRGR